MVDIPIACSSSMGASSTGGILLMGCLSLLLWGYSYRLCRWAAFPPLPFSGLARACDAWLPPTVASADVSPRSSRFAKSCAALSAGRPVDGRGRADPSGLGRARERSAESSRGNLSPAQRQMLPTVAPKTEIRDFGNKSVFLRKSPSLRASGTPTGASNRQWRMPKV